MISMKEHTLDLNCSPMGAMDIMTRDDNVLYITSKNEMKGKTRGATVITWPNPKHFFARGRRRGLHVHIVQKDFPLHTSTHNCGPIVYESCPKEEPPIAR